MNAASPFNILETAHNRQLHLESLSRVVATLPALRQAESAAVASAINEQLSSREPLKKLFYAYRQLSNTVFTAMEERPEPLPLLHNKNFCSYSKRLLRAIAPHPAFSERAREQHPLRVPVLIDYLVEHYSRAKEIVPESSLERLRPHSIETIQEVAADTARRADADPVFRRVKRLVPALVLSGVYESVPVAQSRYHEILGEARSQTECHKLAQTAARFVFCGSYPSCAKVLETYDTHYQEACAQLQNEQHARLIAYAMLYRRFKTIEDAVRSARAKRSNALG